MTNDYAAVRLVRTGAAALATFGYCIAPVAAAKSPLGGLARL